MCPGSIFIDIHLQRPSTEPFYTLPKYGISHNKEKALESMTKMTGFDAAGGVFVYIAHDEVGFSKKILS
jgi:hypothetical protein